MLLNFKTQQHITLGQKQTIYWVNRNEHETQTQCLTSLGHPVESQLWSWIYVKCQASRLIGLEHICTELNPNAADTQRRELVCISFQTPCLKKGTFWAIERQLKTHVNHARVFSSVFFRNNYTGPNLKKVCYRHGLWKKKKTKNTKWPLLYLHISENETYDNILDHGLLDTSRQNSIFFVKIRWC
jgi:hypothetical protein